MTLRIVRNLWSDLCRLWSGWSRCDAIRSSPTERHWLKLAPPCLTVWHGERIEVLSREEHTTPTGPVIRLECLTPRGHETLLIHPGGLHQSPKLEWQDEDVRNPNHS
ncbi:MAG: hypothetical protein KDA84_11505 [Planctomycetaceae bacterium]|nr:hypothetical protein [Planctomycetaceae bacterium]